MPGFSTGSENRVSVQHRGLVVFADRGPTWAAHCAQDSALRLGKSAPGELGMSGNYLERRGEVK